MYPFHALKIFLYILNGISLDCHTCLNQANWVDISNNIFWFIIENNYFIFINYYFYIIFTFIFEKKKSSKTTNHTCIFLFQWRIIWELKIWVPLKYYLYNSVRTDGHLFILHYLFLAQYRCSVPPLITSIYMGITFFDYVKFTFDFRS